MNKNILKVYVNIFRYFIFYYMNWFALCNMDIRIYTTKIKNPLIIF